MVRLESLRPATRRLVILGLGLAVGACFLLPLTGLHFGQVHIYGRIEVGFVFYSAVVVLMVVGWGYVLAAALGAGAVLRWTSLTVFTALLIFAGIGGFSSTRFTAIGDIVFTLALLAPCVAFVWLMAAYRALRGHRAIGPVTVFGTTLAFALFFIPDQGLAIVAGSTTGNSAQTFLIFFNVALLVLLAPLALLSGYDLAELMHDGVKSASDRLAKLHSRFWGPAAAILVAVAAFACERVVANHWPQPADTGYTALAAIAAVALLWRLGMNGSQASAPITFQVAVAATLTIWAAYGIAYWWTSGAVAVQPVVAVSAAIFLAVAAVLAARPRRRFISASLLLALIGVSALFWSVPNTLGLPVRLDLTTLVGFVLIAVTLGAQRWSRWSPLRDTVTVGTAVAILIRLYVWLVFNEKPAGDLILVSQVALLVVLFALAQRKLALRFRVVGAGAALALLAGAVAVESRNATSQLSELPAALLLAIGILWDVLMSGGRLTNGDSGWWPRESRLYGYLGYALVGLGVAIFSFAAPALSNQLLTALPAAGLLILGVPIVVHIVYGDWRKGEVGVAADPRL